MGISVIPSKSKITIATRSHIWIVSHSPNPRRCKLSWNSWVNGAFPPRLSRTTRSSRSLPERAFSTSFIRNCSESSESDEDLVPHRRRDAIMTTITTRKLTEDKDGIEGYLAHPEQAQKGPALLLIHQH